MDVRLALAFYLVRFAVGGSVMTAQGALWIGSQEVNGISSVDCNKPLCRKFAKFGRFHRGAGLRHGSVVMQALSGTTFGLAPLNPSAPPRSQTN